ncbi:hypothetical protein AVEN_182115-1 [Araneus ventricosus]|uniref:Lipase domain-containing protein n=1 Tax=Araneus ventricosus TaxID=182803 RepID=A0A4Y2VRA5_ARAVE|nr:hypothetical protein AVEN_182115-1 [Araneus ventricosus]
MPFSEAEPLSLDASVVTLADQYLKKSFKDISDEASSPPMNKNSSIQYLLFTPDHPDTPCYLEPNMEALKRCPFNPTYPMKIVIHGFIVTLPPGNLFFVSRQEAILIIFLITCFLIILLQMKSAEFCDSYRKNRKNI